MCAIFLEGEIMTNELKTLAMNVTPSSIRIGLDVDILDIKQGQYEYSSDKLDGYYDNTVVAIQMKHKFIEDPFWITLFTGAQRRESSVAFVAAFSECKTDMETPIYESDAINPQDLDEGPESLQEIVDAFDYLYFTEDDANLDREPLFYEDPMVISSIANEILKESNVIIYNTVLSRENPSIEDIKTIHSKLNEVTKTQIKNVWIDENDYDYGNKEEWLIRTYADFKSTNVNEGSQHILYVGTLEKIMNILETDEQYIAADYTDFRIFLNDLVQLDADMYIF